MNGKEFIQVRLNRLVEEEVALEAKLQLVREEKERLLGAVTIRHLTLIPGGLSDGGS